MSRSTARGLAIGAIAAQMVFIAAWVIAGALEPGYSHAHFYVSELGAATARHPWIVNAAIVGLGLGVASLGPAVAPVLPRRPARSVVIALFVIAGLAIALAGPVNLDCMPTESRCHAAWKAGELSWQTGGHMWLSFAGQLLLCVTPFALARALFPSPLAAASLGAGAAGLFIGAIAFALENGRGGFPDGVAQRFDLLVLHAWIVLVAGGILWALRDRTRRDPLVPLRPRDVLAREWTGDGELVLRPLWLGRLFAQPFTAHRRTTSMSETLWRIDDEADFGNGRVDRRRTYCEFVSGDHLVLTAADLPDGAELWLEEGGYLPAPFRMAFPLGPLSVMIRVHDRSYAEAGGVFVNRYDAYLLGTRIPVARITFRVAPVAAG